MKEIRLTQGQVALVDDEDFEWLNQWKWYAHFDGQRWYARRREGSIGITMHRVILELQFKDGIQVDHINHNGLDNRRRNLRVCTPAQNQHNCRKLDSRCPSRHKGVTCYKGRWMARIVKDYKTYHLGRFDTEKEAAQAYNTKALEFYGEWAYLNDI
jgi:hypothetical protein